MGPGIPGLQYLSHTGFSGSVALVAPLNLPRSGIKPLSPLLACRFSSIVLPEKSHQFFILMDHTFAVMPKDSLPNPRYKRFSSMFSSKNLFTCYV